MTFRDDEQRYLYEAAFLKGRMKNVAAELENAFAALQVDNISTALACISRAKTTADAPIDYGTFGKPAPSENPVRDPLDMVALVHRICGVPALVAAAEEGAASNA